MAHAIRLAGGWALALIAALVLSAVLAAPTTAPSSAALADAASPTPLATPLPNAGASSSDEVLPPFPHWPPPGWVAGSARPVRLIPLPDELGGALQAATDRARDEMGLQAMTVGISVSGQRYWAGASGLARDGVTPLDGDSPFAIASITKTFTAALVLQLVEEGRLSLDGQVAALLPDVGLPAGVTVRQLLSHTSGIADLLAPMREPMNQDPERRWTAAEVVARVGDPWFHPGAGYGYSNSNYVLLGMLVERITDNSFADELATRLLEPLDLDETGILLAPDAPLLMTPSWASAFGASGFMYSSSSDLLEWATALYSGRVLESGTLATMLAFNEDDYGLGTELIHLGERAGIGHSGLLRGYTSLLVHLPTEGITLVVIGTWQGFDPATSLTQRIDDQPSILDIALLAGE